MVWAVPEHALTRRTLLAGTLGGVGALGVSGVAPAWARRAVGLSASLASTPRVVTLDVGRVSEVPVTVRLPGRFDLAGVQWQGPADAHVQLRGALDFGAWGRFADASAHGHGPDSPPAQGESVGDPVWLGGTDRLQLRCTSPVTGVRLHLIDVSSGRGARALAAQSGPWAGKAIATAARAAGAGQPAIVARHAWAQGVGLPRERPAYGVVHLGFVHHTENPNGYSFAEVPAMLRAIFLYHRDAKGWSDIGYNFVVDRFGRIFEARAGGVDEPVVGAHTGGYNLFSTGVAVLGEFSDVNVSAPARRALTRLLAWKLSLHGQPVSGTVNVRVDPSGAQFSRYPARAHVRLPRIAGHRDADSTDCPGNVLYGQLPGLRQATRARTAAATRVVVAAAPTHPPAAGAVTVSGVLRRLTGAPLGGAAVVIEGRRDPGRGRAAHELTLTTVTTGADGRFSAPLIIGGVAVLRALYRGGEGLASVSEPLALRAPRAPAAAPSPAPAPPAPPPPPSPPPAPGAPAG